MAIKISDNIIAVLTIILLALSIYNTFLIFTSSQFTGKVAATVQLFVQEIPSIPPAPTPPATVPYLFPPSEKVAPPEEKIAPRAYEIDINTISNKTAIKRTLKVGESIIFYTLDKGNKLVQHTLVLDAISEGKATVTIYSFPRTYVLGQKDIIDLDFNNDLIYDVEITLIALTQSEAEFSVLGISKPVEMPIVPIEEKICRINIFLLLIFILLIAIIILMLLRETKARKRKKR